MLDCPSVMSEMSVSLSVLLYVSAWLSETTSLGLAYDSLYGSTMKSTPFLAGTYKRIAKMSVQVINGSNGEPIGHHMPLFLF